MWEPLPVVCLPFAGAGASFFRPWQQQVAEHLTIVPVQLPGHEKRFVEEPYQDVHAAADGLLPEVLDLVGGCDRVVLFGHSLGAVLAFELARRLTTRQAGTDVMHLFVSGSPGPWTGRSARATGLGDAEFVARVREFAGYRNPVLDDSGMRELLLPVLRADVEMHENYRPASDEPLPVPITSVRGQDDHLVTAAQAGEWRAATEAEFRRAELPGGHMYLVDGAEPLLALVAETLAAVTAGRG
jgi:surfactin synthase thioesterase subunit